MSAKSLLPDKGTFSSSRECGYLWEAITQPTTEIGNSLAEVITANANAYGRVRQVCEMSAAS